MKLSYSRKIYNIEYLNISYITFEKGVLSSTSVYQNVYTTLNNICIFPAIYQNRFAVCKN